MSKITIDSEKNFMEPDIWSAGGVVFRKKLRGIQVLICERSSERLFALPKGKPNNDEDEELTAIREVKEETGIEAKVKLKIKDIFYTYTRDNKKIYKKVTFFLMEEIGGQISNHDDEFDTVYWEYWDIALKKLTYQGEKDVLEKAIKLAKGS